MAKADKRKTITREEAIKQLKKLKSFHNGSYGEAINFAIESIKVDMAYDLAYEKVDFIEIPKGTTNGDMINALFPNAKNIRVDGGYHLSYIIEGKLHRNLKEWWNAPYKIESGE